MDDLVSETFAKVLGVLQRGGGPDVSFRAYLFTAMRRRHVDRIRAASRLTTTDDLTPFDPGVPFRDTAVEGFDSAAAAAAFASLPERWQLVLWHTEVEGEKPAEVAALLGMSANSVSALAYRAREGLRQAFLAQHAQAIENIHCQWTNEHLGAYVRNGISRRDAARVEEHLAECRACTAIYLELCEVNSNLRGILGPLLLGSAASGYVASLSTTAGWLLGPVSHLRHVRHLASANPALAAASVAAAAVAAVVTVVAVSGQAAHHRAAAEPPPLGLPRIGAPQSPGSLPPAPPQTHRTSGTGVTLAGRAVVVVLPTPGATPASPVALIPAPSSALPSEPTTLASPSLTPDAVPSATQLPSATSTPTPSAPLTSTPSVTVTASPTLVPTPTPTVSDSPTSTDSVSPTPTDTGTPTPTVTPTVTPTGTPPPPADGYDLALVASTTSALPGDSFQITVTGLPAGAVGTLTATPSDGVHLLPVDAACHAEGGAAAVCSINLDPQSVLWSIAHSSALGSITFTVTTDAAGTDIDPTNNSVLVTVG